MPTNRVSAIKEFFSTPEKPVTTTELAEFKKGDPEGWIAVADALLAGELTY